MKALARMHELGFELGPRSPDLVPSDYCLFLILKKWLGVKKYSEIIASYLEDDSSTHKGVAG